MKENSKVAIQGVEGCFHEAAANKFFSNPKLVECLTFQKLFESLQNDQAEFGVMAIENTIAGSLLQNYALLIKYGFNVIGEVYINIQMNLMALPGTKIEDLTHVQSHPIALFQSAEYLWSLPNTQLVEYDDTALAAKDVSLNQLKNTAALAHEIAAKKYGLEILKRNVETDKQNFTRFLIISKAIQKIENTNKASIRIQLKHEAGSLADTLMVFKESKINLTKIQSVPIIGKPYEYAFHVDLEWDNKNNYNNAMSQIKEMSATVILLGEYKKGAFKPV